MTKPILTSLRGRKFGFSKDGSLVIADGSISPDTGAATATAGAATLHKVAGKITSEALSTAAAANYTLTLTNNKIEATDLVFASVAYGSASAGTPAVCRVTPAAGSVVIVLQNVHSANALNGTIVVSYFVVKV